MRSHASSYRRVGVPAPKRKIHTEVTEVRKGSEGLKGFRIYEGLDFACFRSPRVDPFCRFAGFAAFTGIC
jgi:hypothetical protein